MIELFILMSLSAVGGLVVGWLFLPMPRFLQRQFIEWGWINPNPKR